MLTYLPSEIRAESVLQKIPLTRISTSKFPLSQLMPTKTQAGSYHHLHLIEEESEFGGGGGKGAMCLQSSNKGVGVENDLRFPILYPAGTPLNTLSLGIDSLSVSVGCTLQSKGPI